MNLQEILEAVDTEELDAVVSIQSRALDPCRRELLEMMVYGQLTAYQAAYQAHQSARWTISLSVMFSRAKTIEACLRDRFGTTVEEYVHRLAEGEEIDVPPSQRQRVVGELRRQGFTVERVTRYRARRPPKDMTRVD